MATRTEARAAWTRLPAWGVVIGGSLAAAAASLLVARALSYDAWGWLLWGREIVGHLPFTTHGYPTWKPLAGLMAVPLSPLGSVGPALWLLLARFGAVLAIVMAYRLGRRVAGPAAGGLAALCVVLMPDWLFQSGVGESEPLLTALLLTAVDRHADRADGQGFGLVLLASLLRPESWLLLVVSGAVTWVRRPRGRALVIAGLALVPLLWFGGEYLGSGDPLTGGRLAKFSHEAQMLRHGHTPPFWAVLGKASSAVPVAVLVCVPVALWRALPRRDAIVLPLAIGGVAWIGEVAVLAAMGYGGVTRFLFPGLAALAVVGASGLVFLVRAPRLPLRVRFALAVVGLGAIVFGLGPRVGDVNRQALHVENRQDFDEAVGRLVAQAGLGTFRAAPHVSSDGIIRTDLGRRLEKLPKSLKEIRLPGIRVTSRDDSWPPLWAKIQSEDALYRARTIARSGQLFAVSIEYRRRPPSRRGRPRGSGTQPAGTRRPRAPRVADAFGPRR